MTDTYRAKRVSLQVWIDSETRKALKQAALDRDESVTDIIKAAINVELLRPPEAVNYAVNPWATFGK
jgi:hypothetical protein